MIKVVAITNENFEKELEINKTESLTLENQNSYLKSITINK